MKNIFLIIILILTSSCGYKPIFEKKNFDLIEFKKIELEGDEYSNKKILSAIPFKENKNLYAQDELYLKSNYSIIETSKNTKGQVISYSSKFQLVITIKRDNKIIINKSFIADFDYENKDNQFDLIEYQLNVKNNLIDNVIEKLIIFTDLNIIELFINKN
jgi:hypothetical protein